MRRAAASQYTKESESLRIERIDEEGFVMIVSISCYRRRIS